MPQLITFDALTLMHVLREAQGLVGVRIDKVRQSGEWAVLLQTQAGSLLLSCDPRAPRAYLSTDRGSPPEGFFKGLKDRLEGALIESILQHGFDRRLSVHARGFELAADLAGTHANLALFGGGGALGRLRKVKPPSEGGPASLEEAVRSGTGLSRTMKAEIEAVGVEAFLERASQGEAVLYPGVGAYPVTLSSIAATGMPMASLSQALEKHYRDMVGRLDSEALAKSLTGRLRRSLEAREATLRQIEAVLDTAERARTLQMYGELILAHRPEGVAVFETEGYDGAAVTIKVDPEKTPPENADRYFIKARKAKAAAVDLHPKAERLRVEIEGLRGLIAAVEDDPVRAQRAAADAGYLREQRAPEESAKPLHEGFKVRETEIDGFAVFWGENATANDYVTTRIAKPNDYWLHVRGAHGSHVVLRTQNKPERVPPAVIEKAAVIAAKNSNQKHARHVPVTLTLAKYVRKPRKSAPGAVTFINDRTLFVDP